MFPLRATATSVGSGSPLWMSAFAANTTELPGYGLVNLSASTLLTKDWKALLRVDNLADKVYQTASGFATARRTLYVGLTWAPQ